MDKDNPYKIAYQREKKARKEAEKILEDKSRELYESNLLLSDLNKTLEDRVNLRTSELKKQKDKAERLAKVNSEFISTLSHEIRNPLNAIIGYSELLLLNEKFDDNDKDYINRVNKSGEIILGVINEILDFAKIDSGKVEIKTSDFSIKEVLKNCTRIFERKASEKGIHIFIDCIDDYIKTDQQKITQILINLIGNAVKFTDSGNVKVRVWKEENKLYCRVKDSGIGISQNDLRTLFDPFVQSGEKTSLVEGTGIGLSISKKLVELLSGKIKVSSELGKGSEFEFYIQIC